MSTTNTLSYVFPNRLERDFFDQPAELLGKCLLGQKIARVIDGTVVRAIIVETEAYLGDVDKASHSYKRQTSRNKAMFMQPGTAYVYNIYGVYCCLNISSKGNGCAVLIRAVQPLEGVEKMEELRKSAMRTQLSSSKKLKLHQLGNGPSKLCQCLGITKCLLDQRDLVDNKEMWLEWGSTVDDGSVVVTSRININHAEEWITKPLRFYILGNSCVSVCDRLAEKEPVAN